MKKILPVLAISILILAGLALLLYPTVSNWLAQRNAVSMAQAYVENANAMTEEEIAAELAAAEKYNAQLTGTDIEDPFIPGSGIVLAENYMSILDFGDGMMGYIEIPKIDVLLPIYHGTSERVLQTGVGHMDNTAFPIGGEGRHSVLTGHTGLPSAKLFTDLNRLETGDVFYIIILGKTAAYEVNQILIIEPDNTDVLRPSVGKDYVTLVTCTPYGINSHRLLVRGTHVPYTEENEEALTAVTARTMNWQIIMILSFILLMAVLFLICELKKRCMRKRLL